MAKRKETEEGPRKTTLTMPEDEFRKALEQRIELGQKLFEIKVSRNTVYGLASYDMYGGYVSQEDRQYNKQEFESFKREFQKWSGYNSELLKQAFDNPDNEYKSEYDDAGVTVLMGNEDMLEYYHNKINMKIAVLERMIDKLPLLPKDEASITTVVISQPKQDSKNVFIVHGHDSATRTEAELLVKKLGFEPVVLFKQPNMGDTIIEKLLREAADAAFAIVIYTKCDVGKAVGETDLKPRARQNVVFEHGLMCGLIGRNKVVALVEEGVEVPSDLSGVVYINLDSAKHWQFDVAKEMRAIGLPVDLNKLIL